MQGINNWYNISCNIGNNSTLIRILELPNKGVREVTNDIGIMSQQEEVDIYKKDLILHTHRSGGGLCKKNVTHFVTRRVVPKLMALLLGKNERQTLQNRGWENML